MPVYQVTDPTTGVKLRLTGDSPPTEQELEQIFASQRSQVQQPTMPELPAESTMGNIGPLTATHGRITAREQLAREFGHKEQAPSRETRATRELRELGFSGVMEGEDQGAILQVATALGLGTGPDEMAKVLQDASPNIKITSDEGGNLIANNIRTGAKAVLSKPGLTPQDVMQFGSMATAFTPAGKAPTVAKAVGAALGTEAAIQAGQAGLGGEFDPEQIAMAGGFGAAGKVLEKSTIAATRLLKGGAPQQVDEVIRAGQKYNVPVMTTDVIEPETFYGRFSQATAEKIPIAGTGGVRAAQQKARQNAIRSFAADYGFTPDPVDIIESLKSKKQLIKKAAGARYERIINQVDAVGDIPIDHTLNKIDEVIANFSRPGVIKNESTIKDLQRLKQTLQESPQTMSMMRENRTNFRNIVDAMDSSDKTQLPTFAKVKMDQIIKSMSDDMDDAVKKNLPKEYGKYKQADQIYRREAVELTKSRLKSVLDKGEVTPEQAHLMLFSNKPSENKLLYNGLTTDGRNAARSALVSKAVKDAGGIDDFSPDRFANILKRHESQFNVFFRGDDRKALNGLTKLLRATKRAPQASQAPPTGVQAVGVAGLGSAFVDLGATLTSAGTAGTLARIYESPAVRNILLKLNNTPADSAAFENLVKTYAPMITAGAQAQRGAE